ncbi:hypothetical protein ACFYYY_19535 [Streptomyces sp. NPDC001834]|uniref:hypothetical protein n=1 Tax=Streptomyces sp. NPDC001834 TaxID=3364616 RepID=UPI0036747FAA
MSGIGAGEEPGARSARARAVALLRIRNRATAAAVLPAAVAVVLLVAGAQGHAVGDAWDVARWIVTACAVVVLLVAAAVAVAVVRARPAVSPTVPLAEEAAPDLYRLVRDLADRLGVPAPSAIALTPDCDSWLEDRTHPSAQPPSRLDADRKQHAPTRKGRSGARPDDGYDGTASRGRGRALTAPVLVIGSPFLWWMRVAELRAVLAPVVAGTGPSAHPDIAAARRFVRGLDGVVADAAVRVPGPLSVVRGAPRVVVGWIARLLLRSCRSHAAEMERGVAAAASVRAQGVDYGLRVVAQEQVGLAYAGWDRLLTRVALPAWEMGRWPSRLDAGVVSALTELSRRDRLADDFASRLGERPACDLLEEPGAADEATSLLAARLFHGGPPESGPGWSPVDWQQYPEEVVDRKWRTEAARLHRVLDTLDPMRAASAPATAHSPAVAGGGAGRAGTVPGSDSDSAGSRGAADAADPGPVGASAANPGPVAAPDRAPASDREAASDRTPAAASDRHAAPTPAHAAFPSDAGVPTLARVVEYLAGRDDDGEELAAGIGAAVAREAAAARRRPPSDGAPMAQGAPGAVDAGGDALGFWGPVPLPLFPLLPHRTGTELLADHVAAMVCCAAVDTAGATPGLDWLDGPALLVDGERRADLGGPVLSLVEDGDAGPLRSWLASVGVRPEKPVRLV